MSLIEVTFESLERVCIAPDLAGRLAQHARFEVRIAIAGTTVAVRFSGEAAAERFSARFADMLSDREPETITFATSTPHDSTYWTVPERGRRWGGPTDDEAVVFFADGLMMHEFLTRSSALSFHGAVIAHGETAAALVGISTAGKTTTTLAAARAGFSVYSDERCIVIDGAVVPFLRAITLRDGGRARLVADPVTNDPIDRRLRALPAGVEHALRPSELFGERAGGKPRPLAAIFAIDGFAAEPAIERQPLHAMLPTLLRSMTTGGDGMARSARILSELRRVPTYRLQLGSPHATAVAIERTLDAAHARAER